MIQRYGAVYVALVVVIWIEIGALMILASGVA